MSVNNLHSLLNGRYFIHEAYGKALLPSLAIILNGKDIADKDQQKKADHVMVKPGAASGTSANNQNDYVLVLSLKDPIYKYSQECGPQGTKSKMRTMQSYENDPNLKGVVLDIDSGGGQVSGTPEFYDFLLNYGRPVVAYTDGLMCSAAYYIGSAASYIVANKRADAIGSIGAMVSFIDMTGYYEKLGAKVITEYATKSTEKNRDFEELLKGNAEGYIKNELDPIVETFHADMKAVRQALKDETLHGGTWDADGALSMGLVDELGTLQTAIDKVYELSDKLSNNPKNNTMSKERANLQAVLGLTAPLVETAEKGSYLNADQLDATETALADKDASIATLTGTAATAQAAQATAETALTDANKAHTTEATAITAQADAMLTAAALPVAGTLPEKLTALTAHYAKANAADGAGATKPAVDASGKTTPAYVDATAPHNQIANKIFNK